MHAPKAAFLKQLLSVSSRKSLDDLTSSPQDYQKESYGLKTAPQNGLEVSLEPF